MDFSVVGNSISVLPKDHGFDLYALNTKHPDPSPRFSILKASSDSTDFNDPATTHTFKNGYKESRIAVNKRYTQSDTQVTVFYQDDLYGYIYGCCFGEKEQLHGSSQAETVGRVGLHTPNGTSLASANYGEGSKNDIVFYQAHDNRIYYVLRENYQNWGQPTLVAEKATEFKTTLSAYSYAEKDENIKVDCLCVAYEQSPCRIIVRRMRRLRGASNEHVNTLEPKFEPVVGCQSRNIYGPLSLYYVCQEGIDENGFYPLCSYGDYRLVLQNQENPPRLWDVVLPQGCYGQLCAYKEIVTSAVTNRQIPARGTSISTLYDPKTKGLTVAYNSPEGWISVVQLNVNNLTGHLI